MEFGLSPRVMSSTVFLPISEKEYEEIVEAKGGYLKRYLWKKSSTWW